MKFKHWFFLALVLICSSISAQIKDPAKFKFEVKELGSGQYEAVIQTTLDKGWHINSKDLAPDTAIPTEMNVSGNNIQLVGKFTEVGKKIQEYSDAFAADMVYYSNQVAFKQKFQVKDPSKPAQVVAEFTYQICDDRICLAPNTLEFEKSITPTGKEEETLATPTEETPKDSLTATPAVAEDSVMVANTTSNTTQDPKNLKITLWIIKTL
ncbi:hypothetical protein BPO_0954 [Bergeyella porcorum]|uniref:Thiol:disulfide interchange protein DsbD N-terminal domain-containing protein n=1 Tax=Bergeyella porcorum TaxID=1735111 RepID=A0AAU0F0M9_9FLAO